MSELELTLGAIGTLTGAVGAITGIYALRESKTTRNLSQLPVLDINIFWDRDFQNNDFYGRANELQIKNIGNAPATNIEIRLRQLNQENSFIQFPRLPHLLEFPSVEVGGTLKYQLEQSDLVPFLKVADIEIQLTVTYKNVLGVVFSKMTGYSLQPNEKAGQSDGAFWKRKEGKIKIAG